MAILPEFNTPPEGVTWSDTPQPDMVNNEGISFAQEIVNSPSYNGKELDVRAQKYNYASDLPVDEVKAALMSGEEMSVQQRVSEVARLRNEAARSRLLQMGRTQEAMQAKTEVDPQLAMESEFAAKAGTTVASMFSASAMSDLAKNPDTLDRYLSSSHEAMTKKEGLASVFQQWMPLVKDNTVAGSWGNLFKNTDAAELFVPFLSWYRFRETAKRNADSGLTTATNIEELIGSVYRLPPAEGQVLANKIMGELSQSNWYDAATFLQGLDSYSTSDAAWDNVGDFLNLPLVGAYKYSMKAANVFIRPNAIKLSGVAQSAGNIEEAAKFHAVERFTDLAKATGTDDSIRTMLNTIPTVFNPEKVIVPTANFSAQRAEKLIKEMNVSRDRMISSVTDVLDVKRLDQNSEALGVALKEAEQKLRDRIGNIQDAILDVRPLNADSNLAGVAGVEARIGKKTLDETTKINITLDPSLTRSKDYNAFTRNLEKLVKTDPEYKVFASDIKVNPQLKQWLGQAVKDGFLVKEDKFFTSAIKNKLPLNGDYRPDFSTKFGINTDKYKNLVSVKLETSLGKMDSTFFDSLDQAKNHANDWYGLKPGTYSIREAAPNKFYLSIVQQIDEGSPQVRKALIEELRGAEPNDWTSVFLRKWGSAENLMDKSMSANRKVAVHGTSQLLDAMANHLNAITKPLSKDEIGRFKAFITKQRDFESPNGEVLGKFSKNTAEFETDWVKQHNALPTEAETNAYWNYVQISDFDWTLRNLAQYSKLSQEGWGMIGLSSEGFKMKKPLIEGKIIKDIPEFKGRPATVVLWQKDGNHLQLTPKQWKDALALDPTLKIVKLHPEGEAKLTSVELLKLPKRVRYILTNEVDEAPLNWNRVAYNPGGHRVHVDDWFVSQEKVTRSGEGTIFDTSWYRGDFNISSHMVRSQAQKMVDVMNEARELLRSGKNAELAKFIEDKLPSNMTEKSFRELFEKKGLNVDEPIKLRRKDKNIIDSHDLDSKYPNLVRERDDPHLLDTALEDTSFVGRREPNIPSYSFEGAAHAPTIRIGQSRLLDPLSTLAKTVEANARNLYIDDLKVKHAKDFMARYGDLIDVKEADGLLDPVRHAITTPFKEGTADLERLSSAKAYRESITNFFNIESQTQAEVRTFRDRLLETVFDKFGEDKAAMLNEKMMHTIRDPASYLRAAAFHTKIGLFNIPSFMTQAMQFTTMLGIAGPVRTTEAMAWAQYARVLRKTDNPEIQNKIASLAGQWGGNANDFKDYYDGLKRSGLLTVKGESALIDDDKTFQVAQSAMGKFLDWGRAPFDAGEKVSRIAAFQIAFREWRAATGNATRLTDDALRSVMGRTDDLLGNMTRASLASWQTGFLSLPSQFMNWHIRMGEQMLGTRLTQQEKTRLILTNTVLYGIPSGLGTYGAFTLVPWKSSVDMFLNQQGVPTDSNIVTDTVVNGVMGSFMRLMTGDRFNPNEKWGPGKNPVLDKMFSDENVFLTAILGVGGSTIQDFAKISIPFLANAAARLTSNADGKIEFSDIKDELNKVISSMGNAEKLFSVINTGKYISKNEKVLADVDNWKGWVSFMTGLTPREIGAAGEKQTYLNAIKSVQKTLEPTMMRYHREMYDLGRQGDLSGMANIEKKLKALYIAGGLNEKEIAKFEWKAFEAMDKTWVEKTNEAMMKRNQTQYQRMMKESQNNAKQ